MFSSPFSNNTLFVIEKMETEKSEAQVPLTATEEKKEDMVMNYRLTKKSALGMGLVCLASVFGRLFC